MRFRIVLFSVVMVFMIALVCNAAAQQKAQESTKGAATAQQQTQDTAKAPELTETQQLQLDNLRKDARIADQQVQLAKVQLAEAMRAQQVAQNRFWSVVADLRTKMKAPESEFDFDAAALRFVPKSKSSTPTSGK